MAAHTLLKTFLIAALTTLISITCTAGEGKGKGNGKGKEGDDRPPGFDKGKKKGWQDDYPPGWDKKNDDDRKKWHRDLDDRFAYLHQLSGAGARMCFELAPLRPCVRLIVVVHVAEQYRVCRLVDDEPQVGVHSH